MQLLLHKHTPTAGFVPGSMDDCLCLGRPTGCDEDKVWIVKDTNGWSMIYQKRWLHISRLLIEQRPSPTRIPMSPLIFLRCRHSFCCTFGMPVKVELATLMPLWTFNLGVESSYSKYDI